jgi:gliding motility-associated-like protein
MANKLNAFEKEIKKATQDYSVSHNADQAWEQLESKLPSASGSSKWWMALPVVLLSAVGLWYFSNTPQDKAVAVTVIPQEEKLPESTLTTQPKTEDVLQEELEVKTVTPIVEEPNPSTKPEVSTPADDLNVLASKDEPEERTSPPTEQSDNKKTEVITPVKPKEPQEENIIALEIEVLNPSICANGTCYVTYNSNDFKDENILWSGAEATPLQGDSVLLKFTQGGSHEVYAYVSDNKQIKSNVATVDVKHAPNAQFTYHQEVNEFGVPVVTFMADDSDHKLYTWRFGDGTKSMDQNAKHVYTKGKDYSVQLMVVSKEGCIWTSHNRVTVDQNYNLLAPSSFSPNADGLNDYWFPKSLEGTYFTFELQVFDRSGTVVFESNTADKQWDGRVRDRFAHQGETFVWECKTTDPDNLVQYFSGNIVITR